MFDAIDKLIPLESAGPAILALAAWGAANYLAIGPEIGRRMGDLTYQPRCVASVETLQEERHAEHEALRDRMRREAERAEALARKAMEEKRRQLEAYGDLARAIIPPELRGLLGAGVGGDLVKNLEALVPAPDASPEAEPREEIPATLPPPLPENREAFCGCVVGTAIAESRLDIAFYTGSLSIFVPERIERFDDVLGTVVRSEACGPVPLS